MLTTHSDIVRYGTQGHNLGSQSSHWPPMGAHTALHCLHSLPQVRHVRPRVLRPPLFAPDAVCTRGHCKVLSRFHRADSNAVHTRLSREQGQSYSLNARRFTCARLTNPFVSFHCLQIGGRRGIMSKASARGIPSQGGNKPNNQRYPLVSQYQMDDIGTCGTQNKSSILPRSRYERTVVYMTLTTGAAAKAKLSREMNETF